MSDPARARLELAWWLLNHGLGASAARVVKGVQHIEASRLRHAATRAVPAPGVYALLATSSDEGLACPMTVAPGVRSGEVSPETARALDCASTLVAQMLGLGALPPCHVRWPDSLQVDGPSLALPAALGLLAHFADGAAVSSPVFATGALDDSGGVHPVSHMDAKLSVACAESIGAPCLVPQEASTPASPEGGVATLAEAAARAFGQTSFRPNVLAANVSRYLDGLGREPDGETRVRALRRALDDARLAGDVAALRARLAAELRHLGRAQEAMDLLAPQPGERGREADERLLQLALSECDHFRFVDATRSLEDRLKHPFADARDELRFRGALAQAYSMAGDATRAYATRTKNLELHSYTAELARGEPGTRCALARDAAACGDYSTFARHIDALCAQPGTGTADQHLYNAHALTWGLARMDRSAELLEWTRGVRWPGIPRPAFLVSSAEVRGFPAISIARAVINALSRCGAGDEAELLRARVPVQGAGLVEWLSLLVHLEASAEAGVRAAWLERMREAHADATRFYMDDEVPRGGRHVWY